RPHATAPNHRSLLTTVPSKKIQNQNVSQSEMLLHKIPTRNPNCDGCTCPFAAARSRAVLSADARFLRVSGHRNLIRNDRNPCNHLRFGSTYGWLRLYARVAACSRDDEWLLI